MPHIIIEHNAELAETHDLDGLADALMHLAKDSGVFPDTGAIKLRFLAATHVRIGAGPQTFAHITLKLLAGRDTETKAKLAKDMLAVLDQHLPDVGALSVEPMDVIRETYAKRALS